MGWFARKKAERDEERAREIALIREHDRIQAAKRKKIKSEQLRKKAEERRKRDAEREAKEKEKQRGIEQEKHEKAMRRKAESVAEATDGFSADSLFLPNDEYPGYLLYTGKTIGATGDHARVYVREEITDEFAKMAGDPNVPYRVSSEFAFVAGSKVDHRYTVHECSDIGGRMFDLMHTIDGVTNGFSISAQYGELFCDAVGDSPISSTDIQQVFYAGRTVAKTDVTSSLHRIAMRSECDEFLHNFLDGKVTWENDPFWEYGQPDIIIRTGLA